MSCPSLQQGSTNAAFSSPFCSSGVHLCKETANEVLRRPPRITNGAGPSERVKRTDVHLHLPRAFSFDWCSVSEATIGRCLRRVSRCQTAFWRFRFDFGRGLAAFSVAGDAQIVHLRGPDFGTGFRSPFQDRPNSFLVGGPKTETARWSLFWDRICGKKRVQLFAFR